jgi:hypothetical protein
MVINNGEKVHVIYRPIFEHSVRRHFLGEVVASDGPVCRLEGFVFVYDSKSTTFIRKPERRISIFDLSESGYIVNVIDAGVNLDQVSYRYTRDSGLIATDDKGFTLNINEFSAKG